MVRRSKSEEDQRLGELNGCRVLIVEDEYYLADDLASEVRSHGAEVVGPVADSAQAERLALQGLDCAVIDMNLRGEMAFGIADRLEEAGVPFLIATGYSGGALPERFRDKPRIEKPFDAAQVAAALPALIEKA